MPRKPKQDKQTITVIVNGKPIAVTLHPPTGSRSSWYAYWNGLVASKSTGQAKLQDAIVVAEDMVKGGGQRARMSDALMSDEEFEQIQRAHFAKKQDPKDQVRAAKTLKLTLEAITAFREISELHPITLATADDCAAFQRKTLQLPKNWRQQHPKSRKKVEYLSPNTVLKWSRMLQAAFERANRNATMRKCVRGVVDEKKLLTANPWNQFPWIEGKERPIRQFDSDELLAFLDHFEKKWVGITVVPALAKVFLWSSGRRLEVTSLTWPQLRVVGFEYHFHVVGKWGIEKWFRIPEGVYRELQALRTDSPFVFAAYSEQVRQFYERSPWHGAAKNVASEFDPENLGNWFYKKITAWSKELLKGHATTHIFRKTSLQYARIGEDINRQIAQDARVSETVLMTNYVKETDEQMRAKSNRTFHRILASLSPEVARRYGHVEEASVHLEDRLKAAINARDWTAVADLSTQLAHQRCSHPANGQRACE